MIKNTILLIIFSTLILFAYFWEQKGNKQIFLPTDELEKIFSFSANEVTEIQLNHNNVVLSKQKKSKWSVDQVNFQADKQKIDYLLKTITGLVVVTQIDLSEHDRKEYFVQQNHAFKITASGNTYDMYLGDISHVTGFFYLDVNGQIYLTKDSNFYQGLYKNPTEAEFQKYLTFKNMLKMFPRDFIEDDFLPDFDVKKIDKFWVKRKSRVAFELNLKNNQTSPPIYAPLSYANILSKLTHLWSLVKIKTITKLNKNILSEPLSHIKISYGQKTLELTLYGKLNGQLGNFITTSEDHWIYAIKDEGKDLFFADIQDFWQKKFSYSNPIHTYKNFVFELGHPDKLYRFQVKDVEKFEIEINDARVEKLNRANMNLLFNLILNLTDFKQATFVLDSLSTFDNKALVFQMHIFDKTFKIQFKKYHLIVQDVKLNLEYHFIHKNNAIMVDTLRDFFTLRSEKK